MAVPVIQPNVGCVRRLWDLGSSTVEAPYEWRSAICKQEVLRLGGLSGGEQQKVAIDLP
jgi:hypothetical protein